jgi:fused signal recognition particle receptor
MQAQWQAAVDAVGLPGVVAILAAVALLLLVTVILGLRRGRRTAVDDSGESATAKAVQPPAGLRAGLTKTRLGLLQRLLPLLGRERLDPETVEALEAVLLSADVGVLTTERLIRRLQDDRGDASVPLPKRLEREVLGILSDSERPRTSDVSAARGRPHVIMVIGVNGVGKTTSIGKLAARFVREGKRTLLIAGDTFRAAAIEQLTVWAERSGADLVRQQHGGDPGAVAFDGLRAAVARKMDVVIIDTAGRLHTKSNLMDELRKVRRVIAREVEGAPHETLLVLDAVTGQNGLAQARAFMEALDVTGVVLTKLDGTARGGIVLAIGGELNLPIRYVGVGEGVEDLREFDPEEFVTALLAPSEPSGMP